MSRSLNVRLNRIWASWSTVGDDCQSLGDAHIDRHTDTDTHQDIDTHMHAHTQKVSWETTAIFKKPAGMDLA